MPPWNQDKLQIALCALRPPTDEFRVPPRRPTFFHFVLYLYPVRKWETCPRGKGVCSKANLDQLSRFGTQVTLADVRMRQCKAAGTAQSGGEVSLDGTETKSEDCRVDAGTYVAQATTAVLN